MTKQGMKQPESERKQNPAPPLFAGSDGSDWHDEYDLAAENLINDFDMTAADLQDYEKT